ncbi:pyridoxamine 5'-phosphate oxidase family protein [Saccharopolyspora spinosa]|nr:pyridoxamine 5'-phosphate oxidase family protein [Saccharopolyspora spinosa]
MKRRRGHFRAVLAATGLDGAPEVRSVAVIRVTGGFAFFAAHHGAVIGRFGADPRAAVCFDWSEHRAEVRACGQVQRLSDVDSDGYFGTLPEREQLTIWLRDQEPTSAPRAEMTRRLAEVADHFRGQLVPRPQHWGGYRIIVDDMLLRLRGADEVWDEVRFRRTASGSWGRTWSSC